MKGNRSYLLLFLSAFLLLNSAVAQSEKIELNGHLQNLNMAWIPGYDSEWITYGSIYNRLNFKWYPNDNLTFSTSARNIINYGKLVYDFHPFYSDMLTRDEGWFDLTEPVAQDSSYIFFTNIDRASLKYINGNFEVTAGRQRVNWGINMVWNPNDIFNTFNFFDFDYAERPGCDAVRLQYYTSYTSSIQAAVKIDRDEKITAAALYKFNKRNYDIQFLGGVMRDDIVLGTGWSGDIKNAGFTGEASWFRDRKNFSDTTGIFVLSIGANYTFKNSLFIHASGLFNSEGTTSKAGLGDAFVMNRDLSPKNFTLAKYALLAQISYPITPLIKGDISGIINPSDGSFFIGPNVDFSLTDNISFLVMAQLFQGSSGSEYGDIGQFYYTRLKWSF